MACHARKHTWLLVCHPSRARRAVILSGAARVFAFPAICAGAQRSRRTSLRCHLL